MCSVRSRRWLGSGEDTWRPFLRLIFLHARPSLVKCDVGVLHGGEIFIARAVFVGSLARLFNTKTASEFMFMLRLYRVCEP